MFKWLIKLLRRKPKQPKFIHPSQVINHDANIQEICAQAFNAPPGHMIIGHVDDSGKLHTEEVVTKYVDVIVHEDD